MLQIAPFAQLPILTLGFWGLCDRLLGLTSIGTGSNDSCDTVAELLAHNREVMFALVFDDIVQQGRYRLILISTVVEHEARNAKKVRDVRHLRALAHLCRVSFTRVFECTGVSGSNRGHGSDALCSPRVYVEKPTSEKPYHEQKQPQRCDSPAS